MLEKIPRPFYSVAYFLFFLLAISFVTLICLDKINIDIDFIKGAIHTK
jgi:hypothetical protein